MVMAQPGSRPMMPQGMPSGGDELFRDVWASNLEEEMKQIRRVVQKYSMVAMDTEFPGIVARPLGEFKSTTDYQYQLLRCNVGLLKLIQVGLTFMNENGELAPEFSTWQFNFKFSLGGDMFAQNSIELLKSSGLQFQRHEEDGIDPLFFAEVLMTSGLVLNDEVTWLSFHSGYDFGYLLKLLTNQALPNEESEFFEILKIYFPKVYDVKYLMKSCRYLKGGLQEVADQLEVQRIGPQHQAGSDSLLTGLTYFRMKEMFFEDNMDESRYCGYLYGLGLSYNGDSQPNALIPAYEEGHGEATTVTKGEGDAGRNGDAPSGDATATSTTDTAKPTVTAPEKDPPAVPPVATGVPTSAPSQQPLSAVDKIKESLSSTSSSVTSSDSGSSGGSSPPVVEEAGPDKTEDQDVQQSTDGSQQD